MVNSDKGITNLQMLDASMPAMIRTSGQMWNQTKTTRHVLIPIVVIWRLEATIDFCKERRFDPTRKCSKRRFDGTKSRRIRIT
jgi:isocitrate dehydrogenase